MAHKNCGVEKEYLLVIAIVAIGEAEIVSPLLHVHAFLHLEPHIYDIAITSFRTCGTTAHDFQSETVQKMF